MSTFNPFGTTNNQNTGTSGLFGTNNKTNNPGATIFGNSGSSLFPNLNNQTTQNNNTLFGTPNQTTQNNNTLFGTTNQNTQNNNTLFGTPNQNNVNNNQNQNQANNNTMFNLSGINNNQNQNQNQNQNFFNNQNNNNNMAQNQLLDLNNNKNKHDLDEYQEALINLEKCFNPYEIENMFKDYLYMPIHKGQSPIECNQYRPYTQFNNQKIINDYKIWEEATKNNKNPNEFFPIKISSVNTLLNRNKSLEKGILTSIGNTIDNEKNLEKLNKKIDDEMNNKISDLKNCYLKANELEIDLSSKIAQFNYLAGTAKESIVNTQEIKDNIKKTNDNINKNNMVELCEKIKKSSNENFVGQNKNYIKDMNKTKINEMLDSLVEIKNMMNVIYNSNKKNLDIITGMEKEANKIFK